MYCLFCVVRAECKNYADETGEEHGVWGGELRTRKDTKEEDDS